MLSVSYFSVLPQKQCSPYWGPVWTPLHPTTLLSYLDAGAFQEKASLSFLVTVFWLRITDSDKARYPELGKCIYVV